MLLDDRNDIFEAIFFPPLSLSVINAIISQFLLFCPFHCSSFSSVLLCNFLEKNHIIPIECPTERFFSFSLFFCQISLQFPPYPLLCSKYCFLLFLINHFSSHLPSFLFKFYFKSENELNEHFLFLFIICLLSLIYFIFPCISTQFNDYDHSALFYILLHALFPSEPQFLKAVFPDYIMFSGTHLFIFQMFPDYLLSTKLITGDNRFRPFLSSRNTV